MLAKQVATGISNQIQRESLFSFNRQKSTPVLLILDRRDDPLTPLLTQWTYQAMVHQCFGIANNRVDLREALKDSPELKEKQIVLSVTQDEFFKAHHHSNFGDLGVAVKEMVDGHQKAAKMNESIATVEDMQRVIENIPAFRSAAHNVTKHVALLGELAKTIGENNLMEVSELEQALASDPAAHDEHFALVQEKLQWPQLDNEVKLRLVMIYTLRYEAHPKNKTGALKETLRESGLSDGRIRLIDALLEYGGARCRPDSDLYGDKSAAGALGKMFKQGMGLGDVENVYTKHKPLMHSTLEALFKGTLKEAVFPATVAGSAVGRPQDVIVFMIGGTTFEEEMTVANMNAAGRNIVLGGTTVQNSKRFLDELGVFN
jgi:hypothetical protein